jgi:hypothetical protein
MIPIPRMRMIAERLLVHRTGKASTLALSQISQIQFPKEHLWQVEATRQNDILILTKILLLPSEVLDTIELRMPAELILE